MAAANEANLNITLLQLRITIFTLSIGTDTGLHSTFDSAFDCRFRGCKVKSQLSHITFMEVIRAHFYHHSEHST